MSGRFAGHPAFSPSRESSLPGFRKDQDAGSDHQTPLILGLGWDLGGGFRHPPEPGRHVLRTRCSSGAHPSVWEGYCPSSPWKGWGVSTGGTWGGAQPASGIDGRLDSLSRTLQGPEQVAVMELSLRTTSKQLL